MLSLIAGALPAILGIFSSAIPQLVGWMEKGQRFKHEIELTKLKMEAAARGLDNQIFLETIKASANEAASLRDHDTSIASHRYIDYLRASVRPAITYVFFFTFVGIKIAMALVMLNEGSTGAEVLKVVWDDYTNAIFGAIVGFWFGSRAMMHTFNKKEN